MINVNLCGGSGTRLWPLSRSLMPKQFVRLFDGESLFQQGVRRNQRVCHDAIIVSNTEQYFLAQDQLEEIQAPPASFLLEPEGRNTAPAIAMACHSLPEDELVLVSSSDHVITDEEAYEKVVGRAKQLANEGFLVTFGIEPEYAETGYGYIETQQEEVLSFKEKPDRQTALEYINQGNYLWNSGMFCFKVGVFLEELKTYAPEIYETSLQAVQNQPKSRHMRIGLEDMQEIPADSIDYAVMEKSNRVKVVPCEIGWSDLGSFDSLYDEVRHHDSEVCPNAVLKTMEDSPDLICVDSKNNLVVMRERQIALVDLEDLIVVDTSDALLISKKGSSQKIKKVVDEVKTQSPDLADIHRLAYRPWGTYEVLIESPMYKVKRIVVLPGKKLSLQKHYHRNEHWIIVSGTATVTVDDDRYLVRANESTYVQMGQVHRLENEGKINLVMVEVQVGEYTGEDDIVRIEDVYGREQ